MSRPTNRYELTYRLCACTALVLALVVVMCIWHLGRNSMIACGFMGAFFIHYGARPPRRELAAAVIAGCGFGVCYLLLRSPFGGDFVQAFTGIGAFMGLGSLVVMSVNRIWERTPQQRGPFLDGLVIPIFSLVAGIIMDQVGKWNPPTYDLFLFSFDASLGFVPGTAVASLFKTLPWLRIASGLTYALLLLFPPFYHAWTLRRGTGTGINMMYAFTVGGICGAILYQVCPAIGPLYCFGRDAFPFHLPAIAPADVQLYPGTGVHNAMPSMHMTWALLVLWSAWELPVIARYIASVFVGLTFLSTLGSGEHYLVDLIVAVPLALAIESICAWSRQRTVALRGILTGFALVLGWLALLRTPAVARLPLLASWTFTLATITVAALVHLRLRRSLRSHRVPAAVPSPRISEPVRPVVAGA